MAERNHQPKEIIRAFKKISNQSRSKLQQKRAEPPVFSLKLEFRKLLEPSLRGPASNINKQVRGTVEQLKVKGLLRALC